MISMDSGAQMNLMQDVESKMVEMSRMIDIALYEIDVESIDEAVDKLEAAAKLVTDVLRSQRGLIDDFKRREDFHKAVFEGEGK